MDRPCVVCGDPVSALPVEQAPRCSLCWDLPDSVPFVNADPRFTDAEWEAWHAGAPSFAPLPGMEDAHRVRTEYHRWQERHARNGVKTTADWFLYQRVLREYAELEG